MDPDEVYDLDERFGKDAVDASQTLATAVGLGWVVHVAPSEVVKEEMEAEVRAAVETPAPAPEVSADDLLVDTAPEEVLDTEPEPEAAPELEAPDDALVRRAEQAFTLGVAMKVIKVAPSGKFYSLHKPDGTGSYRFRDQDAAVERLVASPEMLTYLEGILTAEDSE